MPAKPFKAAIAPTVIERTEIGRILEQAKRSAVGTRTYRRGRLVRLSNAGA
jgi:hypothetical protein